nr:hypothetical protein [Rubrobacter indicoceani]
MEDLLPDILEGKIEPGRVFDRTVEISGIPDGYRTMDERESIKAMVRPWRPDEFWQNAPRLVKRQVATINATGSGGVESALRP